MARPKKKPVVHEDQVTELLSCLSHFPSTDEEYAKRIITPREELVRKQDSLKEVASRQAKERKEIWKIDSTAYSIARKLADYSQLKREQILLQVFEICHREGSAIREDLFTLSKGVKPDAGAVFDNTPSGKRIGGAPMQARPSDSSDKAQPDAAPTPALPLDEAQRAFEEASAKSPPKRNQKAPIPTEEEIEEKNRELAAQRAEDSKAFDAEDGARSNGPPPAGEEADPQEADTNVVPLKRGRGRPPKAKKAAGLSADEYVEQQNEKLGGPPPAPLASPPEDVEIDEEIDEQIASEAAAVPDFIKKQPQAHVSPSYDQSLEII